MKYYIDELKIIGIRNSTLFISGWVHEKKYSIKVVSGNKVIDTIKNDEYRADVAKYFKEGKTKNTYGFRKAIKLKNKYRFIKIYLVIGRKETLIAKTNNLIISRIMFLVKNTWKRIYFKCFTILKIALKFVYNLVKNPKILFNRELYKYFKDGYKYDLETKVLFFDNAKNYNKYLKKVEKNIYKSERLTYQPLISVLIPVYNAPKEYLDECINSILNQTYQNFEICLADDASPKAYVKKMLKEYEKKDSRIKVVYRSVNGNISQATNSCLSIAKGEFVALVDNDDTLTPNALYENVLALNSNPKLDFIYSDEDKINLDGIRCNPHYKADWSPDTLLSINYITHFAVIRKNIVEKVGGFRTICDGAQDYDMFLRVTEVIPSKNIYHIPKVLYNWRMSPTSTALNIASKSYASEAGRRALQDALDRRKIKGTAKICMNTCYYVDYDISKTDKVSIIIPTKDRIDILDKCINSIYKYTDNKLFEIIIINNNSVLDESKKYFKNICKKYSNISVVDVRGEFNFSKLNNVGLKHVKNKYVLFLNNDIEIKSKNWLETMIGYAKQKHVGAVGCELLYPNNTIQHAGVVLGMGRNRVASHPFMGQPKEFLGYYERILVPYNYSAVTAACMLVEKKKLDEIKGFDEKLKVSYNDVDLCLRLMKNGYYNVFLPQVKIYHHESLSRGYDNNYKKMLQTFNEIKYFKSKWNDMIEHDPYYNPNYSLHHPFMLNEKIK